MSEVIFNQNDKPQIDSPCFWNYKIFLPLHADANKLCSELLGESKFSLAPSKSNSKFAAFNLRVWVESDEARLELFSLLKRHCAFVL